MNETTFENARVGDAVWYEGLGWGEVSDIDEERKLPLVVEFEQGTIRFFSLNGVKQGDINQTLFWDEIPIIAPPRPKRMVTKTVEVWMNVYSDIKNNTWLTQEAADKYASPNRIACVKLTGSYEVEE
jgi:hypothetical protein